MRSSLPVLLLLLAAPVLAQPIGGPGSGRCQPEPPVALVPSSPYPDLSPEAVFRFTAGHERFTHIETPASGLGPVFNGASCAECHRSPRVGGASDAKVTRFGFGGPGGFDPLFLLGGSLLQREGLCTPECTVPGETVPLEASLVAQRDTPPLFGLGLIDAIPDANIARRADPNDRDHDGISGRAHRVGSRIGRFGWKAQVATLFDFATIASLNELGITSPLAPNEVSPQGGVVSCDLTADPEDDGSGVQALADFMTFLPPLPRAPSTRTTRRGRRVFRRAGCSACHVATIRSSDTVILTGDILFEGLRKRPVPLFSDLLLHDMGPDLADGIAQGAATGREFRTTPLWGVAQSAPYLHDGRAPTLEDAINAHAGEADRSRARFLALAPEPRAALLDYLRSL